MRISALLNHNFVECLNIAYEEIKDRTGKISGWCLDQGGTIKMTEEIFNNGFDKVNRPNHYCGKYGLESIDVIRNFAGSLKGSGILFWKCYQISLSIPEEERA